MRRFLRNWGKTLIGVVGVSSLTVLLSVNLHADIVEATIALVDNGEDLECSVYAEIDDPDGVVSVEIRIYAPNGSLLMEDAVFRNHHATAVIETPIVGPGEYHCFANVVDEFDPDIQELNYYHTVQ